MWYIITAILILFAMFCGYFVGRASDKYIEDME